MSARVSAGAVDSVVTDGTTATVTPDHLPNATCLTISVSGIAGPTGDQDVQIAVLAGDANGDTIVDIFDLIAIRKQLNQPVTTANFGVDVKADRATHIFDLITTRNTPKSVGHRLWS